MNKWTANLIAAIAAIIGAGICFFVAMRSLVRSMAQVVDIDLAMLGGPWWIALLRPALCWAAICSAGGWVTYLFLRKIFFENSYFFFRFFRCGFSRKAQAQRNGSAVPSGCVVRKVIFAVTESAAKISPNFKLRHYRFMAGFEVGRRIA